MDCMICSVWGFVYFAYLVYFFMINKFCIISYCKSSWSIEFICQLWKKRHNDPSGRIIVVLAFSLVVLGLVGWRGDWVLVLGVLGLARTPRVDDSVWRHKVFIFWCWEFALWALSWAWEILCFLCSLVPFPLCWAACLEVADGGVSYIHSLARLKLGVE